MHRPAALGQRTAWPWAAPLAALLLAACNAAAPPADLAAATPAAGEAGDRFEPVPDREVALRLHGFRESFEIAPVLLAADRFFPPGISIRRGGIPNLVGAEALPGYGDPGTADIATHAETQLLRYSVAHPNLRVIMTVTEGDYRIVARRSAGIAQLSDLRGKRVATMPATSAGYFLGRMLAGAGLDMDDVVLVADLPLEQMGEALAAGDVDALAIWEPESEQGALALGEDLIGFSGKGIYREVFNLNTTAEALADPARRALIRQFLAALVDAGEAIRADPARAQQLVGQLSGHPPDLIAAAWPHHTWVTGKAPDLVDVLVEEEQWLAGRDGRAPRERGVLARLVDYTLLDEVMAGRNTVE